MENNEIKDLDIQGNYSYIRGPVHARQPKNLKIFLNSSNI